MNHNLRIISYIMTIFLETLSILVEELTNASLETTNTNTQSAFQMNLSKIINSFSSVTKFFHQYLSI